VKKKHHQKNTIVKSIKTPTVIMGKRGERDRDVHEKSSGKSKTSSETDSGQCGSITKKKKTIAKSKPLVANYRVGGVEKKNGEKSASSSDRDSDVQRSRSNKNKNSAKYKMTNGRDERFRDVQKKNREMSGTSSDRSSGQSGRSNKKKRFGKSKPFIVSERNRGVQKENGSRPDNSSSRDGDQQGKSNKKNPIGKSKVVNANDHGKRDRDAEKKTKSEPLSQSDSDSVRETKYVPTMDIFYRDSTSVVPAYPEGGFQYLYEGDGKYTSSNILFRKLD
jgi:hypothetical protein